MRPKGHRMIAEMLIFQPLNPLSPIVSSFWNWERLTWSFCPKVGSSVLAESKRTNWALVLPPRGDKLGQLAWNFNFREELSKLDILVMFKKAMNGFFFKEPSRQGSFLSKHA